MAKIITKELADFHLNRQGLRIGEWNELTDLRAKVNSIRGPHCGRMTALESANFSQHIAGWVATGDWKILQIDNSSSFTRDQSVLLSALLVGPAQQIDAAKDRTFLFEFTANEAQSLQVEIVISHIINLLLVWEAHGYLASSGGTAGERLGLQDGFPYFFGTDPRLQEAKNLLTAFEAAPNKVASWVNAMNAQEQNARIAAPPL